MHPILLQTGTAEVRWYGVMIAPAFLAGTGLAAYAWRESASRTGSPDAVSLRS